ALFKSSLVEHASGVRLLAAPQELADLRQVSAAKLTSILRLGRSLFPTVLADIQDCYHEDQLAVLRSAQRILLVLRPDFTALRNARRILKHLEGLGIPERRLQLVANRVGQASELPNDQLEAALARPIAFTIPDDPRTMNRSNNMGVPVVLEAPTSKV